MSKPRNIPLDPPNRELKKRMPPNAVSANDKASSNYSVLAVYPNAIEITGLLGSNKGMGVFGGLICLCGAGLGAFFLALFFQSPSGLEIFIAVIACAILAFFAGAVIFFRADTFTFRNEPVLFNRATRKVYVFRVRRNFRRPFSRWPLSIDTYDWDCAHGEVGGGLVPVGKVMLLRYKLYLAITESPTSGTVIDRFFFGSHANNVEEVTWLWEHIRRYMEAGGPPVPKGEILRANQGFTSHREIWARSFPWLAKDLRVAMRKDGFWFDAILSALIFPAYLVMGFTEWFALWTGRDHSWPDAIKEQLGGPALPATAVEIPGRPDYYPAEPEGETHEVSEEKAAHSKAPPRTATQTKAAKARAADNRKTMIAIGLVAVLMVGGWLLQRYLRGY